MEHKDFCTERSIMKPGTERLRGIIGLALLMLFAGSCPAIDFTVTDVIHVGPIYGGGMIPPMQWSPDGSQLAYFGDGQLMLADTLGNSHAVTKIELPPHRFVWIDDNEIFIFQQNSPTRDSTHWQLNHIDVETGEQTVVEEFTRKLMTDDPPGAFSDPYTTIEGNAFYYVKEEGKGKTVKFAQSQVLKQGEANLMSNHIMRTGTDAIYLVRADLTDSIKISNKPYKGYVSMSLSPDHRYVMPSGVIVRLEDDNLILLDTLTWVKENKPEGTTGCGFGLQSFNPRFTEVAFNLSCDDGHTYVIDRMGVYDYITHEFMILDDLVGLTNCTSPVYAPDGLRIAFIAGNGLNILNREVK